LQFDDLNTKKQTCFGPCFSGLVGSTGRPAGKINDFNKSATCNVFRTEVYQLHLTRIGSPELFTVQLSRKQVHLVREDEHLRLIRLISGAYEELAAGHSDHSVTNYHPGLSYLLQAWITAFTMACLTKPLKPLLDPAQTTFIVINC
ncbi:hypothetical protein XENORESO_007403, partial [Xenotaenia resolanae]